MLRILLTIFVPLLAPFAFYFAWAWLTRRQAAAGDDAWKDAPWVWLTGASVALAVIVMGYLYVTTGHPAGTKLAPPALIDGKVVPSHPID